MIAARERQYIARSIVNLATPCYPRALTLGEIQFADQHGNARFHYPVAVVDGLFEDDVGESSTPGFGGRCPNEVELTRNLESGH